MIENAPLEIQSLIDTGLPALSPSALRIAQLAKDYETPVRALAEALGSDPVLAASVLRAANSPVYALSKRVTALPMAVSALGNQAIYNLVMLSVVSQTVVGKKRVEASRRVLLEHSVAVGLAAREICQSAGLRPSADQAFLCGLLHDIGKILLLRYDDELYSLVANDIQEQEMLDLERETYGYDHQQIGALVTERWNFPEEITRTIADHHLKGDPAARTPLQLIVYLANYLAHQGGIGFTSQGQEATAADCRHRLNLSEEELQQCWVRVQAGLQQFIEIAA